MWEVQTRTLFDNWTNCWHVDDMPLTFTSHKDAEIELNDHIQCCKIAVDKGLMSSVPDQDEFRIVEIEESEK